MVTRHDKARADYRVGDEVTFTSRDGPRRGEIVKLNPKRAQVRCEKTCWNVPYGLLRRAGKESARNGEERLNGVAGMARRLMDEHGLTGWTLAFVEAKRRLGDCHFQHRVIRISRTHAQLTVPASMFRSTATRARFESGRPQYTLVQIGS